MAYTVGHVTPERAHPAKPSLHQLQWLKTALEVFLLLLAVPWLVHELINRPGHLTQRIAGHHMGGA